MITIKINILFTAIAFFTFQATTKASITEEKKITTISLKNFYSHWSENRKSNAISFLSYDMKVAKLYRHCDIHFGMSSIKNYLNPIPVDPDPKKRYFILRFRAEDGMLASILFEIEWKNDLESKFQEMLWIMTDFHSLQSMISVPSSKITRSWYNPWDNDGKLLVKDERTKKYSPDAYWKQNK